MEIQQVLAHSEFCDGQMELLCCSLAYMSQMEKEIHLLQLNLNAKAVEVEGFNKQVQDLREKLAAKTDIIDSIFNKIKKPEGPQQKLNADGGSTLIVFEEEEEEEDQDEEEGEKEDEEDQQAVRSNCKCKDRARCLTGGMNCSCKQVEILRTMGCNCNPELCRNRSSLLPLPRRTSARLNPRP